MNLYIYSYGRLGNLEFVCRLFSASLIYFACIPACIQSRNDPNRHNQQNVEINSYRHIWRLQAFKKLTDDGDQRASQTASNVTSRYSTSKLIPFHSIRIHVGRKKRYKRFIFSTNSDGLKGKRCSHPTIVVKDLILLCKLSKGQVDAVRGKKLAQANIVGDECSDGTQGTTSFSSSAKHSKKWPIHSKVKSNKRTPRNLWIRQQQEWGK